jgi:hypothetical protein
MSNAKLRITPGTVTGFAVAFVATDYLQYRMKYPYIDGVIWKRVLGDNTGTVVKPRDGR